MSGTFVVAASSTVGVNIAATYTYVTVTGTAVVSNANGPALFLNAGTSAQTIVNSGSVEATGTTTASYGVVLAGGGTITNATGGLISGIYGGADINTAGSVVNNGSIAALNGTRGAGILLASGGGVTNAGVISGANDGVFMNAAGAVSNSGSIGGAAGNGVAINGAGAGVVNGTLSTISGYRMAVSLGSGGTVVNLGSIISTQTSGSGGTYNTTNHSTTLYDVGVFLQSGGVNNAAGATISSYFFGIGLYGGGSIANAGNIIGSSTTIGVGAFLLNGGTVSNAASGTITGNYEGIVSEGTNGGTVVNAGIINGSGRAGVDLLTGGYFGNSGTVTSPNVAVHLLRGGSVHNTGSIGSNDFSVYVVDSGTVDNAGTITGSLTMAGAIVRLEQGGTITNESGGKILGPWIAAQVFSNSTGSVPGTILNQGVILAADALGDGAGAWMKGPGLISNGSSGTISGGAFGVVTYNYTNTVINQGSIYATEFAVAMGSGGANRVIVSPGASFVGTVNGGNSLGSTAASALELTTGSGIGSITGFGSHYINFAQVTLDAGASWSLGGTVVAGETISFAGAGALTLANPGSVAGTITGLGFGDTIALAGITDATSVTLGAGNLLTVAQSSGPAITLQLDPNQTFANTNFPFTTPDGNTDLIVPCFAAGTRILTTAGETPVEALRPGDRVVLARGHTAPVVWIGDRRVDCRAHATPGAVMPVCIRAGAVAPGAPARDLWLSPDHAVHLDGLLVPVRCLVNGRSIVQVAVDAVTYFHVELPRHEVLLAEGLPAECYLDTGNRSAFAGEDPRAQRSVTSAI